MNLRSLICSLYTLCEQHKIFLKINLKTDIFLDINNGDRFYTEAKIFPELDCLVNQPSLRRFSYHLLKPILNSADFEFLYKVENKIVRKEIYNETILLKKYLQKFNYNYRRYFIYQSSNPESTPTDKEMNVYAIKILFLLVGI